MATSLPGWRDANEFALLSLAGLEAGQRGVVFVFDPELRLAWPEDSAAEVVDGAAASWRVLPYRGNDMSLRARYHIGAPTVIWVRPPPASGPEAIDLTTLADMVAQSDAFIDISLAGMLGSLLPGVILPTDLSRLAPSAASAPRDFAAALRRVLTFRPGLVTRRHVLAAALCQYSRSLEPAAAWLDESSLNALLGSYVRVAVASRHADHRAAAAEQLRHVGTLTAREGSVDPSTVANAVAKLSVEAFTDYVYAVAAAVRNGIGGPRAAAQNYGLCPAEITTLTMDQPSVGGAIEAFAKALPDFPAALSAVAAETESRGDPAWVRKLQGLLGAQAGRWLQEPTAAVRLALLAARFEGAESLGSDELDGQPDPTIGSSRFIGAVEALQRIAATVAFYEGTERVAANPAACDLATLVAAYVDTVATAELDYIAARRDAQVVAKALGESTRLLERVETSRVRAEERRTTYDGRLAELLRADSSAPLAFAKGVHRWLPDVVLPQMATHPGQRVWLLVFDGLRWDLWQRVLRPALEEAGWETEVAPGIALLPTATYYCRRSLLAGSSPAVWGSVGTAPTELNLVTRALKEHLGNTTELTFKLKAEQGDDFGGAEAAVGRVNVRIYQTPDHQMHQAGGVLRDVAQLFHSYLRENVIPELRAEITQEDLVFISTDHGFCRVPAEKYQAVQLQDDKVDNRFVQIGDSVSSHGIDGIEVTYPGFGRFIVATGEAGYVSVGRPTPSTGFHHGGATLAEMVIPMVQLRARTVQVGELVLELTGPAEIDEDADGEFEARLVNGTDREEAVYLVLEARVGGEFAQVFGLPIKLAAGASGVRRGTVRGREGLDSVRAVVRSGAATLAARALPVSVNLRKGLVFKGLDALDKL